MSVKYKYLFQIDGIDVYPIWNANANLKWEVEGEFVFKRLKLNGTFTLTNGAGRKDFNLVWAQDLDHQFTFRAQYIVNGVVADEINGTFYKTDCPLWDEDKKRVDVVVQTIDRYEKLMKAFDKEFDLVGEIQPESFKVNYKKEPLIQIAFPNHTQLYQRVGNSVFVNDIPGYLDSQLIDFGFVAGTEKRVYIPGTADMTPDVSGIYELTDEGSFFWEYTRLDGVYKIIPSAGAGETWQIRRVSDNNLEYFTEDVGHPNNIFDLTTPFIPSPVFTADDPSDPSQCVGFPITAYQRILTDATTVGGDATIVLQQPDIGDLVFTYDNYIDQSGLVAKYVATLPSDEHTTTPTKYGKYDEDAVFN